MFSKTSFSFEDNIAHAGTQRTYIEDGEAARTHIKADETLAKLLLEHRETFGWCWKPNYSEHDRIDQGSFRKDPSIPLRPVLFPPFPQKTPSQRTARFVVGHIPPCFGSIVFGHKEDRIISAPRSNVCRVACVVPFRAKIGNHLAM